MSEETNIKKDLISIIVPCYNEEEVLPLFYAEITKTAAQMNYTDFEFIFVNDGSKDKTLKILKEFAAKDDRCIYISFSRNFGKEAAMYAGFCNSSGNYTAVMDADLQDPPALLSQMYDIIKNDDYDSVATCRSSRKGEPKVRSFFARQFYKIINHISDADIVDGARDFRMMSKTMVDSIVEISEYNRFSKGIFGWIGFKTKWLPYENIERAAGTTKWSFWKLFKYSIDGIVNFSVTPLYISSLIGIVFCIVSIFLTLFFFLRRLIFGDPVTGWASLACLITFVGGVQLFCLGVLGQYMARTYMETKHRPKYIIKETNKKNKDIKKDEEE